MVTNKTLLVIFVTLASVTAQTFQYSRGWTNGKRNGHREDARDVPARDVPTRDVTARNVPTRDNARGISASLEKIISPCQMNKLRYVLEGNIGQMLQINLDDSARFGVP
ncbi:Corazonin [Operophtera brumata]|uniref:Pro-corazonin n=1 Tax=Operophtera brumata TaxID=104452 RepID=A0A0L7LTY6_OPEBR|nr:Corazonin [Operophtera brumata]